MVKDFRSLDITNQRAPVTTYEVLFSGRKSFLFGCTMKNILVLNDVAALLGRAQIPSFNF